MGMFLMHQDDMRSTGARSWYRDVKPQTPEPVKSAVDDYAWQMFRGCRLKGQPTFMKLDFLAAWLDCWADTPYETLARVQVENYLGALKRGGFIREAPDANQPDWHVGLARWQVIK